ncbi:MAG: protein translocase subunit SecF [Chloroflexi bacterium]|nr:protein translocase subunit SecF [Chloroflexota bacterium]
MIDFVGRRRIYAVISLLLIIPSLIGLALWQFEAGLDFAGGLETEVRFLGDTDLDAVTEAVNGIEGAPESATINVIEGEDGSFVVSATLSPPSLDDGFAVADLIGNTIGTELPASVSLDLEVEESAVRSEFWFPGNVSQDEVRSALETVGLGGARIQATADSAFRLRVEQPSDGDLEGLRQRINESLRSEVGPIVVLQSSSVSGTLSVEIARDAGVALAVAAVAILIYISLAFRRLPNPMLYGAAAIVALMHDVTIVAGVFAIGGRFADLEVNAMFITALLAIIGYSVNDTIVVFDRIRENLLLDPREDFRRVVNSAITQSLGRSLNTSITVVLALLALLLIGGVTIRPFVIVLFIGTVAGTYSSIAVASQIVFLWQDGTLPKLLRMRGERRVVRRVERQA